MKNSNSLLLTLGITMLTVGPIGCPTEEFDEEFKPFGLGCVTDADCPGGALHSCSVGGACLPSITLYSQGTTEWPDEACNPTNSFGGCDTNAQDHADAWATKVCAANGWASGQWTGNKMAGCSNTTVGGDPSVSMYCQSSSIPCVERVETTCQPSDQTIVEITCSVCSSVEVSFDYRCYHLDGAGGVCEAGYTLAPQSVLTSIAGNFVGKDYKNTVSNNCCIEHADTATEGQDWGMDAECNTPGPFTEGPVLGGAGCTDTDIHSANQLTFCVSE